MILNSYRLEYFEKPFNIMMTSLTNFFSLIFLRTDYSLFDILKYIFLIIFELIIKVRLCSLSSFEPISKGERKFLHK